MGQVRRYGCEIYRLRKCSAVLPSPAFWYTLDTPGAMQPRRYSTPLLLLLPQVQLISGYDNCEALFFLFTLVIIEVLGNGVRVMIFEKSLVAKVVKFLINCGNCVDFNLHNLKRVLTLFLRTISVKHYHNENNLIWFFQHFMQDSIEI